MAYFRNNVPGRPTMATMVGEFFQFGLRLSRYGDEVDVAEPFGELSFGYR